MYSVVLLMALSGSGEMPVACHRGGGGGRGCHAGGRHRGGRHGGGGCGYGGGCGSGGCGYGGGYAVGCSSCGGPTMGYASAGGGGCPGGVCAIDGSGVALLADAQAAPAKIVVDLPADATLTIDDAATKATSATRVFVSPSLPTGQEYHYTLKAEVVRDGKAFSVEKTIAVRGGEETRVALRMPEATVASR
jgi:uncharacterized protein (TIGR03000 family)